MITPQTNTVVIVAAVCWLMVTISSVRAQESIWLEAEHMGGFSDYCWPGGPPERCAIEGQWGLSGPGWAAEWVQGGESGFLSMACKPGEDRGVVSRSLIIP